MGTMAWSLIGHLETAMAAAGSLQPLCTSFYTSELCKSLLNALCSNTGCLLPIIHKM
jgi:hypothetical protein